MGWNLSPLGLSDKMSSELEVWVKLRFLFYFFFVVLGLELGAFTLNHSTSPIFVKGFSR
jgi:hypothetical protein